MAEVIARTSPIIASAQTGGMRPKYAPGLLDQEGTLGRKNGLKVSKGGTLLLGFPPGKPSRDQQRDISLLHIEDGQLWIGGRH